MAHRSPSLAHILGKGFAYLQDTVDVAVTWGCHKLRRVNIPEQEGEHPLAGVMKRILGTGARFLGELGESFYEEYENIKAKRKS